MQNSFFQMKRSSLVKSFWFLIVTMLLGLFQAGTVQAQSIQIELMASETSWANTEFVGHAFICISIPVGSGIREDCFGFYPREGGKAFIGGPGVVNSEFQRNPGRFSRVTVSFKRPISDTQRRQVIRMVDDWNSRDYNLIEQSCIDFVNSIAQALGWRTPPRVVTDLPATYLTKLVDANHPINNVPGTWAGSMVMGNRSVPFSILFQESGGTITGQLMINQANQGPCDNLRIDRGGSISFSVGDGNQQMQFTGSMSSEFSSANGTFTSHFGNGSWSARKQ